MKTTYTEAKKIIKVVKYLDTFYYGADEINAAMQQLQKNTLANNMQDLITLIKSYYSSGEIVKDQFLIRLFTSIFIKDSRCKNQVFKDYDFYNKCVFKLLQE